MNRPPRCSRPAAVLGLLLIMILLLGGWGVMSLAPQSALGRALTGLLAGDHRALEGSPMTRAAATLAYGLALGLIAYPLVRRPVLRRTRTPVPR